MLGDDPDSSVTTDRFGFGAVFGRTQEGGSVVVQRGCVGRQIRGERNSVGLERQTKAKWSEEVNEDKGPDKMTTEAKRERETANGYVFFKTCRCKAHDAMI